MLLIGLTGGIGSGKSTVAHRFEQLGIPVIDADVISHQLVEPGEPALKAIVDHFGKQVLNPDGSLDRGKLRQRVFSRPEERKILESILHPLIREEILRRVEALNTPYCILSIPLLIESGWNMADRILVVDTAQELQIKRAQQRDHVAKENIQAIIDSQIDRETRLAAADDVLSNDNDIASLLAQVDALHKQYLVFSRQSVES